MLCRAVSRVTTCTALNSLNTAYTYFTHYTNLSDVSDLTDLDSKLSQKRKENVLLKWWTSFSSARDFLEREKKSCEAIITNTVVLDNNKNVPHSKESVNSFTKGTRLHSVGNNHHVIKQESSATSVFDDDDDLSSSSLNLDFIELSCKAQLTQLLAHTTHALCAAAPTAIAPTNHGTSSETSSETSSSAFGGDASSYGSGYGSGSAQLRCYADVLWSTLFASYTDRKLRMISLTFSLFERIDPEYASPKEYSYLIHSYATSLAHSNSKDDDKNKMLLKRIMKRKMLLKELKIMYLDERWFHHNRWSFILLFLALVFFSIAVFIAIKWSQPTGLPKGIIVQTDQRRRRRVKTPKTAPARRRRRSVVGNVDFGNNVGLRLFVEENHVVEKNVRTSGRKKRRGASVGGG